MNFGSHLNSAYDQKEQDNNESKLERCKACRKRQEDINEHIQKSTKCKKKYDEHYDQSSSSDEDSVQTSKKKRLHEELSELVGTSKLKCKGCGTEMTKTKLKNHLLKTESCTGKYDAEKLEALRKSRKRVRNRKDYRKQYYENNTEKYKKKVLNTIRK